MNAFSGRATMSSHMSVSNVMFGLSFLDRTWLLTGTPASPRTGRGNITVHCLRDRHGRAIRLEPFVRHIFFTFSIYLLNYGNRIV